MIYICRNCGKEFKDFPYKKRQFCSNKCSSKVTINSGRFQKGIIPFNKKEIDMELVKRIYYEDKKTLSEIAKQVGISLNSLSARFDSLGLKKRYIGEYQKGKKLSKETRKKISLSTIGENHHFYGKHHSEEAKRKMSESAKGRISPKRGKGEGWLQQGYKKLQIECKSIFEHHYIWLKENKLGFNYIPKGFIIHHKNGIRNDNRIENIIALPRDYHTKLHNYLNQ